MVSVNWQFQAAVPSGPSVVINQPHIQVSGYDVVSVTVPAAASNLAVPVQPSTTAGDVILMIISSNRYDPGITYTVDGVGVPHALDAPHLLMGSGAVSLLNAGAPPQNLNFSNTLTSDVSVQILAGRKIP